MTPQNLEAAGSLLPVAIGMTFVGARLARSVPTARYHVIVQFLLIGVGCKLVWDGVAGLEIMRAQGVHQS